VHAHGWSGHCRDLISLTVCLHRRPAPCPPPTIATPRSDAIRSWTRLQRLEIVGAPWRISTTPAPDFASPAAPRDTEALKRAADAAVARQRDTWPELLAPALGSLTRLTSLALTDTPLRSASSSLCVLTALRRLELEGCVLRDLDVVDLLGALTGLTRLSLAGSETVTVAAIAVADRLCPHLQELDVSRTAASRSASFGEWRRRGRSAQVVWQGAESAERVRMAVVAQLLAERDLDVLLAGQ
jgi:hypothetical protein